MLQQIMLQQTVLSINSECYNKHRCYNEQFLSINPECYNKHRCYKKHGGILSANVVRLCTWCVGPFRF